VVLKNVEAVSIGQLAALAIRESLNVFGIAAGLKWPNDVLVNGKKIAGILAERDSDTGTVVLGVGLNVNITLADLRGAELDKVATSMLLEKESSFDIGDVRTQVISSLESEIMQAAESASLVDRWAEYDCLTGCIVTVSSGDHVICGRYLGVDAQGRLRLKEEEGSELALWSGDVEKLGVSSAEMG
jgi:BirA family biotin operon repressor/biotin-[acetyl-CoA-carboxylase] ligase